MVCVQRSLQNATRSFTVKPANTIHLRSRQCSDYVSELHSNRTPNLNDPYKSSDRIVCRNQVAKFHSLTLRTGAMVEALLRPNRPGSKRNKFRILNVPFLLKESLTSHLRSWKLVDISCLWASLQTNWTKLTSAQNPPLPFISQQCCHLIFLIINCLPRPKRILYKTSIARRRPARKYIHWESRFSYVPQFHTISNSNFGFDRVSL